MIYAVIRLGDLEMEPIHTEMISLDLIRSHWNECRCSLVLNLWQMATTLIGSVSWLEMICMGQEHYRYLYLSRN